jgi:hypothetical protein
MVLWWSVFLLILSACTSYYVEWWNFLLPVLHDLSDQISQCMLVDFVTNSPTISPHAFSVVGTPDICHHSTSHMPTHDASLATKECSKYTFHSVAMFVFCILPNTASPLSVRIFDRCIYQLLVAYFHQNTHLCNNNSSFRTYHVSVYYWISSRARWIFRPFRIWYLMAF